jgi:hypothetical protein
VNRWTTRPNGWEARSRTWNARFRASSVADYATSQCDLEHVSRSVFLAGEVRLELTRGQLQRLLAYRLAHSPTWSRDLESNQDLPLFRRTRKPCTQSLVGCGSWSCRTSWLRRRESNSRREVMGLAASPDARHITKTPSYTMFSRTLVEGTGLEPVLPAYQTGILPLNEPSMLFMSKSWRHAQACKYAARFRLVKLCLERGRKALEDSLERRSRPAQARVW